MHTKPQNHPSALQSSATTQSTHFTSLAIAVFIAVIMLVAPTSALADYTCTVKERKATETEIDMANRVVAALRASLLPPTNGWTMSRPSGSHIETSFCSDFKNSPVSFGASSTYAILASADAQRAARVELRMVNNQLKELLKLPPDMKAKADQLDEKRRELVRESMAAHRAKDAALSKSKYAEAEVVARESSDIKNKYSTSIDVPRANLYKKIVALESAMRPRQYTISLKANGAVAKPAKNVLSFGSTAKTDQSTKNIVRVVVVIAGVNNDGPDDATLEQLKTFVDRGRLQTLAVGQIPTIEASTELMAKQADAIKALELSAQEFDKQIRDEVRKEESGEAAAVKSATTTTTTTTTTEAAKTDAVSAKATEPAKTTAAVPPQTAAKPQDPAQQAKDTVNKLKGLFGK